MIHRKRTTYGTHSDVSITTVVTVNFDPERIPITLLYILVVNY